MAISGAFRSKTMRGWTIDAAAQPTRDAAEERSVSVAPLGETRDMSPPPIYEAVVDGSWGEYQLANGDFTLPPDAYTPRVDQMPTGRNVLESPQLDTRTGYAKVLDKTGPGYTTDITDSRMDEHEPLGTFVPDTARRAGFSALAETNSFARRAREWVYRDRRTRYTAERWRHEAPLFANPAETPTDQGATDGIRVYRAWQRMTSTVPRLAGRVDRVAPDSPANYTKLDNPLSGQYEDTSVGFHG